MTLQEAKDQISFKYFSVPYTKLLVLGSQLKVLDEAAELYARSKFDEACTLTNRNIIHHTKLSLSDLPAKPEFKP